MSILLLSLLAVVQGPFITGVEVGRCENSHLVMLASDTLDTRRHSNLAGYEGSRFLVKFQDPPGAEERLVLGSHELTVEGYLPNYAFLVTGKLESIRTLLDQGLIAWAGPYLPSYKLSPALFENEPGTDTLMIWLYEDTEPSTVARYLSQDLGLRVYSVHQGLNNILRVSLDPTTFEDIAALNAVRWVEPFYSPTFHNNQAQWVLQSWDENNRSIWDRGLTGEGIIMSTGDAGITTGHHMFADSSVSISDWGDYPNHRKIVAYKPSAPGAVFGDMASVAYHGTHTGCTVCGEDSYWGENSTYDGMAPDARLYFIDVGSSSSIAYPDDYNDMYQMPWEGNQAGGAKLSSNSWGSGEGYNAYTLPCRQTDEFTWNHPDFLILFSAGNSGGAGISPPATAKNIISVGATYNGFSASTPAGFSSIGPTEDGRIKPTLTAPGELTSADGGGINGYQTLSGTSMSCPAVAGAAGLVAEYLKKGYYPSGVPSGKSIDASAALLKAMLISSSVADFYSNPIPDPVVGWGRVCLDSVLYFSGEDRKLYLHDNNLGIETGQAAVYRIEVLDDQPPLRVTLCWSDFPAELSAAKMLVNDLDLQATSPLGKTYKGNVFGGNFSQEGGESDDINVEECLRIDKPSSGSWEIKIRGTNLPQGPQPYAVVVTGAIEVDEPELRGSGIRIDDSGSQLENCALDPGEAAVLYPRVLNSGEVKAESTTLKLSCEDTMVTILTQESSYGDIQPGGYEEGGGFEVELDPQAGSGDQINFIGLAIASGGAIIDTIVFPLRVGESAVEEKRQPGIACRVLYNPEPLLQLTLTQDEKVSINVHDPAGRLVCKVGDRSVLTRGRHILKLEASLSSGIYFITVNAGELRKRLKVVKLTD